MIQFIQGAGATIVIAAVLNSCTIQPTLPTDENNSKIDAKIFAAPKGMNKIPDHYIVLFNDDVDIDYVNNEIQRLKGNHDFEVTNVYDGAIAGFSGFILSLIHI